eukprot:Skav205326  [mRNA]  locus=scaffold3444:346614:350222:- [translate_table: standard]
MRDRSPCLNMPPGALALPVPSLETEWIAWPRPCRVTGRQVADILKAMTRCYSTWPQPRVQFSSCFNCIVKMLSRLVLPLSRQSARCLAPCLSQTRHFSRALCLSDREKRQLIVRGQNVNGEYANREYVVPMATHEGALLASYSRGSNQGHIAQEHWPLDRRADANQAGDGVQLDKRL